jgi:DNA invertase Pin-like site-specific DNA recombinase
VDAKRAIPLSGGAAGRHRHQRRTADDRRVGGLADVERDLIRTRTAEGRSRAQKNGQHVGRLPRLTAAQKAEARRRRAEGATLAELAHSYDVSIATISFAA